MADIDSHHQSTMKNSFSIPISVSPETNSNVKFAAQMKYTNKIDQQRTESPKDVINYEFDSNPDQFLHNSNAMQHNRKNSTDSSTISSSIFFSLDSALDSSSHSKMYNSETELLERYAPPEKNSLSVCKGHSNYSNHQMKELVDILQTRKHRLGPNNPKIADSLTNIGSAHFRRGEHELSVDAYVSAHSIYKVAHGHDHVLVATSLVNVGIAYLSLEKFEESTESFEDALLIYRGRAYGDDQVEVASTLHNLGLVNFLSHDYAKAGHYLTRALEGRRKILGHTHVDVARTLDALGNVYVKMKKFVHALKYHHNALRTKKAILGSRHASVVVSYINIAHVHRELSEYDDAILFYMQAFEAQISSANDDVLKNQEIGTTLHLIGLVQVKMKKKFDALKSFCQASKFYHEAGLTEKDNCVIKLKEISYTVKKLIRGDRSFSCY